MLGGEAVRPVCVQVNWQRHLGGGEIYTRFLTRALQDLGWEVRLVVARDAKFWRHLGLEDVRYIPIEHGREIPGVLPSDADAVVTHTILPPETARVVAGCHRLGGIVHMPLRGRDPRGLSEYHRIFAVSAYVGETVRACGHTRLHEEPLLGVADLEPRCAGADAVIVRHSPFDWDRRKFRDRLLSWLVPPLDALRPRREFTRGSGLTLGIVSRLTPIKQFPRLFGLLAPVLAEFPGVAVEVFGSGGYASVRDLKLALAPLGGRVRFWGHQSDPAAIYPHLDYVLSGLPEREALGLNLIEAQACGTPVIAVAAPPFTETVVDGAGGYLYTDPRTDGGAAFRSLMRHLLDGAPRIDPRRPEACLDRFSMGAFRQRVAAAMESLTR